jgi:hypothetical protein
MRHDPASGAIVILLRSLKMHGMAQAVGELLSPWVSWPEQIEISRHFRPFGG